MERRPAGEQRFADKQDYVEEHDSAHDWHWLDGSRSEMLLTGFDAVAEAWAELAALFEASSDQSLYHFLIRDFM